MLQFLLTLWYIFCVYIIMCRCGSGLSGEALTDAGHNWVGVDISKSMLGKH